MTRIFRARKNHRLYKYVLGEYSNKYCQHYPLCFHCVEAEILLSNYWVKRFSSSFHPEEKSGAAVFMYLLSVQSAVLDPLYTMQSHLLQSQFTISFRKQEALLSSVCFSINNLSEWTMYHSICETAIIQESISSLQGSTRCRHSIPNVPHNYDIIYQVWNILYQYLDVAVL